MPPVTSPRPHELPTSYLEREARLNLHAFAHKGADYCPRCGNKLSQRTPNYIRLICRDRRIPFSDKTQEGCGFIR